MTSLSILRGAVVLFIVGGLAGCSGNAEPRVADTAPLDRLFGVYNDRTPEVVSEIFAPNAVYEDLAMGYRVEGADAIEGFVSAFLEGLPDLRMEVTNAFGGGGSVAFEWIMRGTHTADWPDLPATGSEIAVRGVSIAEVEDGRIVRMTDYYDEQELSRQLGGSLDK